MPMPDSEQLLSTTTTLQLATSVLMEDMAGEAILLNLASEEYFALDEVGAKILHTLAESASTQAAYDILLQTYAVEPEVLRQDLLAYIEQLRQGGLVEVVTL